MSPSLTSTSLHVSPPAPKPLPSEAAARLAAMERPVVSALMPGLSPRQAVAPEAAVALATAPPPQHGPSWTCPKTGLVIPKRLEGNLKWRKRLLDEARFNEGLQGQLRAACVASPWVWINLFAWTFRQKMVDPATGEEVPVAGHKAHQPFITWLVQDEFIAELCDAIDNGHDVLINKARDMGASWLCLTVLHWYWQFKPNVTFLELSRKQQLVDRRGDMDSLFEKHRYLLKWQPNWIKPRRIRDNVCHLENVDLGSSIEGESTNEHAGQGARKTATLLDEFARVSNGDEIDLATADTTACRIYNSTPAGPGTAFTRIYKEKRARILTLPWWRHPEKGAGSYQVRDERGKVSWTSPWYENERKRRSRKDVAQNLDMDHGQAGDIFFDYAEIERHRTAHEQEPVLVGNIRLREDYGQEKKFQLIRTGDARAVVFLANTQQNPWRLWQPLVNGRPLQHLTYVFGIDIANGSGDSNSVITVVCHETGQVVAKFWDSRTSPEELAEIAVFAGIWFGGNHGPAFMCWENNGPGGIFGRKVVKLGYSHFYCQRKDNTKENTKTPRWGWHSNNARKEILLGQYREALAKDEIIQPCKESLDEALDYVYDEGGLLIPGKLKTEPGGGRALHGDHVIADALTILARAEIPKNRSLKARPPSGSFADRRRVWEKKRKAAEAWSA